jgi:membrane protease YdiL (CAAX protease family)
VNQAQVPWKISDAIVVFLVAWIVVPVAVFLLLPVLAGYWPALQAVSQGLQSGDVEVSFGLVMVSSLAAMAMIWHYLKRYGVGWSELGLRPFSIGKALGYLAAGLVIMIMAVATAYAATKWLFPSFNANQEQVNEFTSPETPGALRLSFMALVVLPAILEEIMFRGFMFPAFIRRFGVIGGAVGSSLLFGVAHMQPNIVVYTVILGLILCFLYRKLGSIWPGIGLHMLNNYLAFAAIMSK